MTDISGARPDAGGARGLLHPSSGERPVDQATDAPAPGDLPLRYALP